MPYFKTWRNLHGNDYPVVHRIANIPVAPKPPDPTKKKSKPPVKKYMAVWERFEPQEPYASAIQLWKRYLDLALSEPFDRWLKNCAWVNRPKEKPHDHKAS
jgi:hypothetical protein